MNRAAWIFLLLLLAISACVVWISTSGDHQVDSASKPPAAPSEQAREGPSELSAPVSSSEAAEERVSVETATAEAAEADGATALAEPVGTALRGRVELELDDGSISTTATGRLDVNFWTGNRGQSSEVEVADGAFELPLGGDAAGADRIELRSGNFDELLAMAIEDQDYQLPADRELVFRLRLVQPFLLEVRDAATGVPLAGVDIAEGEEYRSHPGLRPRLIVQGAVSPVRVPQVDLPAWERAAGRSNWLVRADGYAWEPVGVDIAGAGRVVELVPGGEVVVDVTGMPAQERLYLAVYADTGAGFLTEELIRGDGRHRLSGLKAGSVSARVQRGEWFTSPRVFGSAQGQLVPGMPLQLEVIVDAAAGEEAPRFDFALQVDVPAAWARSELRVSGELIDSPSGEESDWDLTSSDGDELNSGLRRFSFELEQELGGDWFLEFPSLGWRSGIVVDHSGLYSIHAPEPGTVLLEVVDELTGAAPEGVGVSWYSVYTGPSDGWSHESTEALDEPGQYRFVAPVGEIAISVFAADRGFDLEHFTVVPGEQRLEYRLPPRQGIRLRALHGEVVVNPTDWSWIPKLERLPDDGGDGDVGGAGYMEGAALAMLVDEPGRFRVTIPDINGYKPVEPVEVQIALGEMVDVDIQVEPKD
ncbi:hypothetical protein [Engelhardtia mirabilis]|uniref:hypothetical protein n=1 Tax=Engelhardtia mirabilis TaxID=2528011 RepID=UPI00119EE54C